MINQKKKIWIDFTDMLSWDGHFTGTQRVTYEIGRRFHEQESNVSFFAYNERSKKFYEVSFLKINERIRQLQQELDTNSIHVPKPNRSLKKYIRSLAFTIYFNLPFAIKRRITREQRDFIRKTYHQMEKFLNLFKFTTTKYFKDVGKKSGPIKFTKNDIVVVLGKPWDNMTFVDELRKQKLEAKFKLAHLIYDMIPIFLPHVFGKPLPKNYTEYMFEAISLSDQLMAISESTKKDIKRFCDEELLPYPNTSVIKLGGSFSGEQSEDDQFSELASSDFVLCVGTIEIRKNHILLYTAYKEGLRRGFQMPKLVIVGGIGWYTGDVLYEFQNDPEMKDRVIIKNNTTDKELDWLYKNCKFTIFPSVYEGWGLPIAESLAYGKMCLASDSSSMKEIASDLIEYFSPYDSAALLELIIKYLDQETLSKKEDEIRKYYKSNTWDQTFKDLLSVIQDLKD